MRTGIVAALVVMMLSRQALCERVHSGDAPVERWFGASAADFAAAGRFAGSPLKVKARFVKILADGEGVAAQGEGMSSGGTLSFLVAAAGGEIVCDMSARVKCGAVIHEMKRATPLVIHGTLDARRNAFLVDTIVQGWGRDQMEGGS
jgi:hypothetical protein